MLRPDGSTYELVRPDFATVTASRNARLVLGQAPQMPSRGSRGAAEAAAAEKDAAALAEEMQLLDCGDVLPLWRAVRGERKAHRSAIAQISTPEETLFFG